MRRAAAGAALFAAAWLGACERAELTGYTLLFLDRSPAALVDGIAWVADPEQDRLVGFDARLRPVATIAGGWGGGGPVSVSRLGSQLLVTDMSGGAVVVDPSGEMVRQWSGPFQAALYAGNQAGDRVVATRSPYRVPTFLPEVPGAPLLQILDTLGRPLEGLGEVRIPAAPFLAQFANAGAVALGPDGAVYFAPLVRDEIVKYRPNGTVVWRASRGIDFAAEPSYAGGAGTPRISHALVNVALTIGPDGRLYALGAADSAGARPRVDVFDAASGRLRHSAVFDSTHDAIALAPTDPPSPQADVFAANGAVLLAEAPPPLSAGLTSLEPPFALPNLRGDTVRLADYAGKVTLINFWASWCHPCREEFPYMADLYRVFERDDFDIAAISDDIDRGAMLDFVEEMRPPFPILVGGGRMKAAYHYRGLPYSLLLDRRGRVVQRIFGFSGPASFDRLRQAIAKEIAGP